ncbi:hypothetical protein [Algoriphagus hitonicola]|uniref:PepSY domain-containing protein n=1 Tax=Algoriphagus hitonicola TaxID=435880 RepID=A0A1I2TXU0_9BACT|nr:hypothetical protein [Algoriphagus hitonicola]SFG67406.1 hypothetical protein SAMN04487988_106169 [Algoriphagus hitonicola]
MRFIKTVVFSIFVFPFLPSFGFAQNEVKIEREVGIKEKLVPSEASEWLYDAFEEAKKPNWFQEFSLNGYSYEAKFRLEGKYYSVEFDSLGKIEDVEIEMDFDELDDSVKKNLNQYFSDNYEVHKISKIQIQYTGEEDDLEDFFDENEKEGVTVRYEIEYRGKVSNKVDEIWEGTFGADGTFITKRKIEIRITDNLIF